MWAYKTKKYLGKQIGKYSIDAAIGEGRYGLCFIAWSEQGEKVILKKFKPSLLKKNLDKNAFEAVILSKLKDKRIPELLGVLNEKGFYGFVLEFKYGSTVKDMLFKNNHEFSSEEIFNIGTKLISIIKYIHANGVVHRDISTSNVLIDKGEVYLIDFGLARFADNNMYNYNLDFSYLGDFLIYLLYSSFKAKEKNKKQPWYRELQLPFGQQLFLKRLLGLVLMYENICDIETDFIDNFKIN